jgi:hypothetical protein
MFKVLAAIHITIMTMLALNDVGNISCYTGKAITMTLPIIVLGLLLVTFALGFGVAEELREARMDKENKG